MAQAAQALTVSSGAPARLGQTGHLVPALAETGSRERGRTRSVACARLVLDVLAVCVAMAVAFWVKGALPGRDPSAAAGEHLLLGLLSVPAWVTMFWRRRVYSGPHIAGRLDECRRIAQATLGSIGLIAMTAFLLQLYVSRGWLLVTAPLAVMLLTAERECVRRVVGRLRQKGHLLRSVVIVGGNLEALGLCEMLSQAPTLGYRPVGVVDDEAEVGSHLLGGHRVLGAVGQVLAVSRRTGASGVIIATTAVDHEMTNRLTRQLCAAGIHVELSSSLQDIAPARLLLRPLGRFPVVNVELMRRDGWARWAKRSFDVVVSTVIGLLVLPLVGLAALAVKLSSQGPVLFRQERVGKGGCPFEILKLRTMVANAEQLAVDLRMGNQAGGPLFKMRRDPRVTRVGRVLRALSIDELPQLWNVLRGDMSLVGPRPALPSEVPAWSPALHGRLAVKPGMTGMWQVSGSKRWSSFDEYARLDLYYVDNWSIWTDLAILVRTVPAVLLNHLS
jgi:exopolysaccharide biosynthesis polyprenyl glycosylphosphotransferase